MSAICFIRDSTLFTLYLISTLETLPKCLVGTSFPIEAILWYAMGTIASNVFNSGSLNSYTLPVILASFFTSRLLIYFYKAATSRGTKSFRVDSPSDERPPSSLSTLVSFFWSTMNLDSTDDFREIWAVSGDLTRSWRLASRVGFPLLWSMMLSMSRFLIVYDSSEVESKLISSTLRLFLTS